MKSADTFIKQVKELKGKLTAISSEISEALNAEDLNAEERQENIEDLKWLLNAILNAVNELDEV